MVVDGCGPSIEAGGAGFLVLSCGAGGVLSWVFRVLELGQRKPSQQVILAPFDQLVWITVDDTGSTNQLT